MMTADFVSGRMALAAAFGAGVNVVFLEGLEDADFFAGLGIVVSRVREPIIGSPTTQSPQSAGYS